MTTNTDRWYFAYSDDGKESRWFNPALNIDIANDKRMQDIDYQGLAHQIKAPIMQEDGSVYSSCLVINPITKEHHFWHGVCYPLEAVTNDH